MKTGLVSVTFRKKTPAEIIALAKKAGLDGIEWGADVHAVDPGTSEKIREQMGDLSVFSLGSYYFLGTGQEFGPVLENALALGAPNIRIWAGRREPADVTPAERKALAEEAGRAADLCAREGLTLSFEYHGGTLTALQESAVRLVKETGRDNVRLYWQPLGHIPSEGMERDIEELGRLGVLRALHVFTWDREGKRFPLIDGGDLWPCRLRAAAPYADEDLLEFVQGDSEGQFLKDAAVLKAWMGEV